MTWLESLANLNTQPNSNYINPNLVLTLHLNIFDLSQSKQILQVSVTYHPDTHLPVTNISDFDLFCLGANTQVQLHQKGTVCELRGEDQIDGPDLSCNTPETTGRPENHCKTSLCNDTPEMTDK